MEQVFLREVKEQELAVEQVRSYKIGYRYEALLGGKETKTQGIGFMKCQTLCYAYVISVNLVGFALPLNF